MVYEVSLGFEKNSLIHQKLLLALICQIVKYYLWVTNIDTMTSTLRKLHLSEYQDGKYNK